MARPSLNLAVAGQKCRASEYNENFELMMDYIEDNVVPDQTGKSGKFLTTDGEKLSWGTVADATVNIMTAIYPVGSIYIGLTSTCPLASYFGTWEKVAGGRVLQGADDSTYVAGQTKEAGLPDHNHVYQYPITWAVGGGGGAGQYVAGSYGANTTWASSVNSIYGNSTTVQPPALVVNIWKRTA
ncbi:MAG: hypothetical protein MJ211_10060 [Bacteroidales bacterium]|nr:hypothetical protein [Bacteroidales bacterium]